MLIAAVAALIIAVSANDNSVNADQVVKETKEQLKGELAGLGGAIAASKKASNAADRQAARDRRRIKHQVNLAVAGGEKQLDRLERGGQGTQGAVDDAPEAEQEPAGAKSPT